MALTGKKRKFADAVLGGKSNKDAAIEAGYSRATASAAGSRLVKDKDVAAFLAAAKIQKQAKAETPAPAATAPTDPSGFDLESLGMFSDPKAFLIAAMNDPRTEQKLRVDAAKALVPYFHAKVGEAGKKEQKGEAAKRAGAGKFAAAKPPLKLVSGK